MAKMVFTNKNVNDIFDGKLSFEQFTQIMTNAGLGKQIFNTEGKAVDTDKVNAEIRAKFFEVLGVEEGTKGKELRRAFRRHMVDMFEVTEEVLSNLIITGWGANPFFNAWPTASPRGEQSPHPRPPRGKNLSPAPHSSLQTATAPSTAA